MRNGFVDTVSRSPPSPTTSFWCSRSIALIPRPAAGLYEGIKKIQFVRANFDSLLGQSFQPVTNFYTMTWSYEQPGGGPE